MGVAVANADNTQCSTVSMSVSMTGRRMTGRYRRSGEQIKKVKSKVQVFDTPQLSTVLRSNLMRFYSPVDLTGNLIMIEKLVSGGTLNRGMPDLQPDALTSAPSCQADNNRPFSNSRHLRFHD